MGRAGHLTGRRPFVRCYATSHGPSTGDIAWLLRSTALDRLTVTQHVISNFSQKPGLAFSAPHSNGVVVRCPPRTATSNGVVVRPRALQRKERRLSQLIRYVIFFFLPSAEIPCARVLSCCPVSQAEIPCPVSQQRHIAIWRRRKDGVIEIENVFIFLSKMSCLPTVLQCWANSWKG